MGFYPPGCEWCVDHSRGIRGCGVWDLLARRHRRGCRRDGPGVTMAANRSPKEERPMTTAGDPNLIYCVKCKAKTGSADLKAVTMKNGRAAAQATCVVCGARKFRIGAIPQQ